MADPTGSSTTQRELPDPDRAPNVLYNPSLERLRTFSDHLETTTEYGSPSYVSTYRSRTADRTRNAIDHDFTAEDRAYINQALDALDTTELVCLDRQVGRHPDQSYVCRLFVPKAYGRIALAWANLFDPVTDADRTPDFHTIQLPDHDQTAIRILPEEGLTVVLGSDYTGEAKKSFLRLFMHRAKQADGLGLHAGSKRVRTRSPDGDLRTVGQVFLGLSATGKSTLTAHGLGLDEPESAEMLQDDVCAVLPSGTVAGSEGHGLFVKTIGLDRATQPELYDAVTHESAVLENVDVNDDGSVDFDSDRYTANGRAVISRDQLASAAEDIDLERVDQVFFITRNTLMPPVAKLSATQAAAAFMLGESIETSAGDPSSAGEAIRVVGTNPFIIGSEGKEGNRFRDLLESLDVESYVLNTGQIGDGDDAVDIGVDESTTILRELARGTVTWTDDTAVPLQVPATVPGLDMDSYRVPAIVADYERQAADLRADRRAYLETFDDLDREIVDAVY
ncbi:phosphoenolpyruvate carboxykinase (ATP) [Halolamina sp. CBA1230]|uniref:phosphoenolpyruvate carboxykinase (ATP) n=1 Tax=Halolamina sp. CBA1230 TaxID=1853690 RepID=UPI0009A17225|nr:phosphoenolpyruvate carboxykinase (ATP) [Halolamina sp. CBA1230]QKY20492.1 phosphoenolpyruvate carboxykinase (ATP) [Halolamina sp. CBA1230]